MNLQLCSHFTSCRSLSATANPAQQEAAEKPALPLLLFLFLSQLFLKLQHGFIHSNHCLHIFMHLMDLTVLSALSLLSV